MKEGNPFLWRVLMNILGRLRQMPSNVDRLEGQPLREQNLNHLNVWSRGNMVRIVSIDPGNGSTVTMLFDEATGEISSDFFPSTRAEMSQDAIEIAGFEGKTTYYDWEIEGGDVVRYVVGDDVMHVSGEAEVMYGPQRYGSDFHRFQITVGCARVGVRAGEIDMILFVPPAYFKSLYLPMYQAYWTPDVKLGKERRDNALAMPELKLVEYREEGDTSSEGYIRKVPYRVHVRGETQRRSWKVGNFTLLPEGFGFVAAMAIDEDGSINRELNLFSGRVLVFDIGVDTLDELEIDDGIPVFERISDSSHSDEGLRNMFPQILEGVRAMVKNDSILSNAVSGVTGADIERALRRGLQDQSLSMNERRFILRLKSGDEIDISKVVRVVAKRYAERILFNKYIVSKHRNLRDHRCVILAGGGMLLVVEYLREIARQQTEWGNRVERMIMDAREIPHLKDVHPIYLNSLGGLRYAMFQRLLANSEA